MAESIVIASSAPVITVPATAEVVKAITASNVETAQATSQVVANASLQFNIFGYNINLLALLIGLIILGILWFAYTIQKSNKLDFADMITNDGRKVSLSKVLQLVGGLTATWIMIKLTLTNTLTDILFGTYLTYVGAIEGYAKFVAAKYGYSETGIKDGGIKANGVLEDQSAQKILRDAAVQASDAEASAKDAKVSIKNAAIDLKNGKDN